jgi:hypothetical protein
VPQLENQRETDTALDLTNTDRLETDFGTQALNITDDCTAVTVFPSVVSNHTREPTVWTSNYGNTASISAFDQPSLGVLGVNWMSPQFQDDVDWDALLAGFAVNSRPHDYGTLHVSQEAMDAVAATGHRSTGYQQPSQALPRDSELENTPSCNATVLAETPSSTEGRYYVDGTGARAPFGGRSLGRGSGVAIQLSYEADSDDMTSPKLPSSSSTTHPLCSQAAYDNLIRHAIAESQHHRLDLSVATFPSHSQVQLYVRHYFDNFHPIFPFVRKSTFASTAPSEWLLLLAVATVGSRYMRRQEGNIPGEVLFKVLDAALQHRKYGYGTESGSEHGDNLFIPGQHTRTFTSPSLVILQAGILNVILLQHSSKKTFVERAFVERHYLVEACHSLELISRAPNIRDIRSTTRYGEHESIQDWLGRETEIRVGMMIWVLRHSTSSADLLLTTAVFGLDIPLRV